MPIDRRTFLLASLGAAACSAADRDSALHRAARFLWSQQAADGGFHSRTYGLLRSGQSLTPFVLGALLRVPVATVPPPDAGVDRAIDFITTHTNAEGALGRRDDTVEDYPNYATALAVRAIVDARLERRTSGLLARMIAQLRLQQFSEANGWTPAAPAYGGWGMGGSVRRPPDAGHVDLSMTRFVLEALQASGVTAADPLMARARVFLEKCQNPDGGFHFSPVIPALNKAGKADGRFASYGSATADGVLALRATGLPETADRLVNGVRWLEHHHLPDGVPGFDEESQNAWGTGLRFYYAAAVARAVPGLPVRLLPQAHDGSFRNPNPVVKEDDPLIATPLAIHVLARDA